ncbi:hypothetical protein DFH11DRAFT_1808453 [Phellopilus nigrolimitatus]|nr:hypothetical protein DFH11DRAFT_1808453 [Phellopilus nigrolimitatus]
MWTFARSIQDLLLLNLIFYSERREVEAYRYDSCFGRPRVQSPVKPFLRVFLWLEIVFYHLKNFMSYSTDVGDSPANAVNNLVSPNWIKGPSITSSKAGLRIAILDSSFNPPTLAHLALARSARHSHDDDHSPCDARLLLLSVRNADKALKAGDASYEQRLEMMKLLAEELEDQLSSPGKQESGNVAVAIIDEPTFVRKSAVLHQFLQDRVASLKSDSSEQVDAVLSSPRPTSSPTLVPQIKLDFLMGFDTLERFLAPRYYWGIERRHARSAQTGDGSSVICAWRGERSPEFANFRSNTSFTGAVEIERERAQSSRAELPTKMSETLSLARPFIKSGLHFVCGIDGSRNESKLERSTRQTGGRGYSVDGHGPRRQWASL